MSEYLRHFTPVEDYAEKYGLMVKREDLCCGPPGIAKSRGIWRHLERSQADVVGVLDARHSRNGHAVSEACARLGKRAVVFYPEYKNEPGPREHQIKARDAGAELVGIPAGRSAVMFRAACDILRRMGSKSEMLPNALKLVDMVEATAEEVRRTEYQPRAVLVSCATGTLAAGVIRGFCKKGPVPLFYVHLGYERNKRALLKYLVKMSGVGYAGMVVRLVDEGYSYKDSPNEGPTPPWPCCETYELKAFRWWLRARPEPLALFWSAG